MAENDSPENDSPEDDSAEKVSPENDSPGDSSPVAETDSPEIVSASPGPDKAGLGTPRGVLVLGEMEEGFEDYVSSRSTGILSKLSRLFAGTIEGLAYDRQAKSGTPDSGEWERKEIPTRLEGHTVELLGGPSGDHLIQGLESPVPVYVMDFTTAGERSWNNRVRGQMELQRFFMGYLTKLNEAGQDERVFSTKAPHVKPRLRGLLEKEDNLVIYRTPVSAGLFDLALFALHSGAYLRQRGGGVDVYLTDLQTASEARVWADAISFLSSELGIPPNLFSAHVEMGPEIGADEALSILDGLGPYGVGIRMTSADGNDEVVAAIRKGGGRVVGPLAEDVKSGKAFAEGYDSYWISSVDLAPTGEGE